MTNSHIEEFKQALLKNTKGKCHKLSWKNGWDAGSNAGYWFGVGTGVFSSIAAIFIKGWIF